MVCSLAMASCNRPSRVEQYRAEKHQRDSVALVEQQRSLAFYQSQLEELLPVADSLLPLFKYEKNEKYQDKGYYVATTRNGVRILVRDDGQALLLYKEGKRLSEEEADRLTGDGLIVYECAEHLQVVMKDIKELEKRINRTSLEVQKYEKRLQNLQE